MASRTLAGCLSGGMNNELYSEINAPENLPRGSPSFIQNTLQQRLQNRINQLLNDDRNITAQLELRNGQATQLRRRVESMSARVDGATRLTAMLHHYLLVLRQCLDDFIDADVRDVMRRLVSEINANRDCIQRLHSR